MLHEHMLKLQLAAMLPLGLCAAATTTTWLHTLSICRSCMRCQNWVYVISRSLSIRHMVWGKPLSLSTGMLAGSGTRDIVTSTFGPCLSFTAGTDADKSVKDAVLH